MHISTILHERVISILMGGLVLSFMLCSADAADTNQTSEWLVFEVTDTGCGISQRGLASLFTEYVQVSNTFATVINEVYNKLPAGKLVVDAS